MTFTQKRHLYLQKPTRDDFRADRERILDALAEENVTISLEALRTLHPLVQNSGYDVTVTVSPAPVGKEIIRVEPGDTSQRLYGLALDIGSTTLEMELMDMVSGKMLGNVGCVNGQTRFGLNILDRILAVKEDRENLEALRKLVLSDIEGLIDRLVTGDVTRKDISALVIGGNTTMIQYRYGCQSPPPDKKPSHRLVLSRNSPKALPP